MFTKQITIIGSYAQITVEVQETTLSVISGLTLDDQCPTTFGIADVCYNDNDSKIFDFCFGIAKAIQGLEWPKTKTCGCNRDGIHQAMLVADVKAQLHPLFEVAKLDWLTN